jgi:CheY-like chemotaxis protein
MTMTTTTLFPITRGDLHFAMNSDGSFVCQEMMQYPAAFLSHWGEEAIRNGIQRRLQLLRTCYRLRTKEEMSDEEKYAKGGEVFDRAVANVQERIAEKGMNLFEQFLLWLSDWWYYHPTLRTEAAYGDNDEKIFESNKAMANEFLLPVLPEQVRKALADSEPREFAVGYGHFAILFIPKNRRNGTETRRIVTDTQLFEYRDVSGYVYLDVLPDGKPVARSRTPRGGERAFFDGVRLMSHDRFQTCAPKTAVINGGYKVNSTGVTIVNGQLLPLLETDDKASYGTGMEWFFGICESPQGLTNDDLVASYAKSEATAQKLRVQDGKVMLDGQELKPIGQFRPSPVELLDSGFALYGWSDFHEIENIVYQHVLVVDDKREWIEQVTATFGSQINRLDTLQTTDKRTALERILTDNPQAVLLDVHLTDEEEFDGL